MRLLAFTLLVCVAENMAIAADPHWTQIAGKSDYSMVVYLDTNSVKVREGRLTAWIQTNYVLPQRTTDPIAKDYSSSLAIEVFDCESERSVPASITLFSGQGGEGAVVARESIEMRTATLEYNRPGSIADATLEAVCRAVPEGLHPKSIPNQTQSTAPSISPQLTNDRHYRSSDGDSVHSPSDSTTGAIPAGASAQCADGTFSFSQHRQGTCSHHGGVGFWMN